MRFHFFKGCFTEIPNQVTLLWVFLSIITQGCNGQGSEKNAQVNSPVPFSNSQQQVPKWPMPHQYGPYLLGHAGGFFSCSVHKDSAVYNIKEVYAGILVHTRQRDETLNIWSNSTLIEYYDTTTRQLMKRIDLENSTPYNTGTYQDISIGGLDYEYMEMYGPDSNCQKIKLPTPTDYYTRNWIRSVSSKGFICVGFELIKMAKLKMVVGWEQTLIVFDAHGSEIMRIHLDHAIGDPLITVDGRFLYFTHIKAGHSPSEPFDPCREAFSIYDLVQKKQVYHREFKNDERVGLLDSDKIGGEIIGSVTSANRTKSAMIHEIIIFEVNLRQVKTYRLAPGDASTLLNIKSFKDQREYIARMPFSTITL